MKKILLALFLITNVVGAQSKKDTTNNFKYRFGFKIAPNVAWLKSDDKFLSNDGAAMGFAYGLTFDVKLSKTFMLTSGFDVTNINNRMIINRVMSFNAPASDSTAKDRSRTSNPTSYSDKLRYIELPLLFSGRTKEIGYMTYFFQAGFTPAILVKQKAFITPSDSKINVDGKVLLNSSSVDEYTSKQDDIAMFRAGFVLGGGVEYNLQGTTSLVGSIRYNNGLFNIMRDPNKEFNPVKNHYISLNIGIVF